MRGGCSDDKAIIGLSIKSVALANAAPIDLLDYVGVGGVYATTSKDNPNPPIGVAGLRDIVAAFRARKRDLPICGIAGIDATNAAPVIAAGADGVAVISALSMQGRPASGGARIARHRRRAGATMSAIAVTIAGSDSGGGAGIQADLKTFSALGVYGASVVTALTAQNTQGVTAIHDVPPHIIAAQIDAVFSDLSVNAVKIGMLSVPVAIATVAAGLERWRQTLVVLDPVMIATSGDRLLAPDGDRDAQARPDPARAGHHAEPARGGRADRHAARAKRGRDARTSAGAARASAQKPC